MLHPKVAFEAPCPRAHCGMKSTRDGSLHASLNQCCKKLLFTYLPVVRYAAQDAQDAQDGESLEKDRLALDAVSTILQYKDKAEEFAHIWAKMDVSGNADLAPHKVCQALHSLDPSIITSGNTMLTVMLYLRE